jgi:uncharacterized protein (TIGR00369 family)
MSELEEILYLLQSQPAPPCAALTPFEIIEVEAERGFVKLAFEPQPAFENHFGNIQGGFAVAMLDGVISLAAFVKQRQWLPTAEIKASFLEPVKIGRCLAEGSVIRAGKTLVFVEGKLWGADSRLAVHSTATLRH